MADVNTFFQTLTERRIIQQSTKPLKPIEFIGALAKNEPIYLEEEKAYHNTNIFIS